MHRDRVKDIIKASKKAVRRNFKRYPLTIKDAKKNRKKDDVVFIAFYYPENNYESKTTFDFPYRQLLPKKIEGLLAAGRSAIIQPPQTRVRWIVFLMGQAAGAAAALAVKRDVTPRQLNVKELQSLLHDKYQVCLGEEGRLR